jgi:pimeloyl-ACP methyl ester carboxylesterase
MRRSLKMTLSAMILGFLAIAIVGLLGYRKYQQNENARLRRIESPAGIQESAFVTVGGIEQFVSIRGENLENPVLLVLHGGMATSYVAFVPFFRDWESHFTVVQWDRRGVGMTYGRSGRAGSGEVSLDRIVEDGIELSQAAIRASP